MLGNLEDTGACFQKAEKIHALAKVNARKWLEFSTEHLYEDDPADGVGDKDSKDGKGTIGASGKTD